MENEGLELAGRLEAATTLLDKTLNWLEEKLAAASALSGEVERVSPLNPLRKTVPAATTEMLAKHGIGEGPVDVRALDAALAGLSLEQRIAVKTQLLRAGAIA